MTATYQRSNRSRARSPYRTGQLFNPAMLPSLRYWLDRSAITDGMTEWVPSVDTEGAGNATFGAGSNSPLGLGYNEPQAYFTGVAGNYISCPDTAALDIVGDLEIVARVSVANSSNNENFVAKSGAYTLNHMLGTRLLRIVHSPDGGTTTRTVSSSAAVSFAAGEVFWAKVTRRVSDGRVQFWTAPDQATEPTSGQWAQLGTDRTSSSGEAIGASSSSLELGSSSSGTSNTLQGSMRRAIVRNGIDGTTVADFDAASCTQTGYTDAYSNVWTPTFVTSGRKLVIQSPAAYTDNGIVLLGTDDWIDVPAAAIPALDTFAAPSGVIAVFRRRHNPGVAAAVFATKNSTNVLGFGIRMGSTPSTRDFVVGVGDALSVNDQVVFSGANPGPDFGVRAIAVGTVGDVSPFVTATINGVTMQDTSRATTVTTSTGGAGRIGAFVGGTGAFDMEFEALLTVDDALTATEIANLVAYYGGGL